MIIDKIENFGCYQSINSRFKIAQNFLESTNFASLPVGRHEISGDEIYAMVFKYDTKDAELNKLEAHKKYIDIQYVAEGKENVGVSTLDKQNVFQKYDDGDIVFQATCSIKKDDTPEALAKKVHALEYEHFPMVVADLLNKL